MPEDVKLGLISVVERIKLDDIPSVVESERSS